MGRAREYDEDAVLTGAMHAFRRKGYQAVSIKDLEAATGLKGGSIYHGYGDKAGLFDAAFAHYNRTVLGRRLADHAPATAGMGGLRSLFRSLLHEPNDESFGCLITNTAIEFGGGDAAPEGTGKGLGLLASTFAERLDAAHRSGELRADIDPALAASKLLVLYQGILVLVRGGADKPGLEILVDAEFDSMTGRRMEA